VTAAADVGHLLAAVAGQPIPGGCESCDAVQTVRREPGTDNVWRMTIAHDDTCPTWKAIRRRDRRGA
jgi:hypothetical protein